MGILLPRNIDSPLKNSSGVFGCTNIYLYSFNLIFIILQAMGVPRENSQDEWIEDC